MCEVFALMLLTGKLNGAISIPLSQHCFDYFMVIMVDIGDNRKCTCLRD